MDNVVQTLWEAYQKSHQVKNTTPTTSNNRVNTLWNDYQDRMSSNLTEAENKYLKPVQSKTNPIISDYRPLTEYVLQNPSNLSADQVVSSAAQNGWYEALTTSLASNALHDQKVDDNWTEQLKQSVWKLQLASAAAEKNGGTLPKGFDISSLNGKSSSELADMYQMLYGTKPSMLDMKLGEYAKKNQLWGYNASDTGKSIGGVVSAVPAGLESFQKGTTEGIEGLSEIIKNGANYDAKTGKISINSGVSDDLKTALTDEQIQQRQLKNMGQYKYLTEYQNVYKPNVEHLPAANFLSDLTFTYANMAPSMMVNYLAPGAGTALLGLSAGGNSYGDALLEGKTKSEALAYGVASGSLEAITQKLLGGIGGFGKSTASKIGGKIASKIPENVFGKVRNVLKKMATSPVGKAFLNNLSESSEELVQANLEPILRNIIFDENNEFKPFSEDKLYAALLGFASAGVINAPNTVSDIVANQQEKAIKKLQGQSGTEQSVNDIARDLLNGIGLSEDTTINQYARSIYDVAQHNSGESTQSPITTDQQAIVSNAKYSISHTTDNKPVVVVQENILENVPKSDWVKKVKQTISEKFSNGIPVSGRLIKVNAISKNEYTSSKYSKYLRSTDGTIYQDKYKSANNLDEIILASTNYVNEDLNHTRKDNFKEFARGDVLIRVGFHDYSAKVIVGFTAGNQMVLYDVVDFTPTSFETKKEDSSIDVGKNLNLRNEPSSSDTIVPQDTTGVNTSISNGAVNNAGIKGKKLNAIQRSSVNVIRKIAEVTGINFELYESSIDEHGNRIGENGSYDPKTNTIRIDIEAGINNVAAQNGIQQGILKTTAHELTHYIKRWSPEKYRVLQDYLIAELNRYDDRTLDALIVDQMEIALNNGKEISYSEAIDEVVADACEMMLKDSQAIKKLAQKDLTLAQKIQSWIDGFAASIKNAFRGISADTVSGRAVDQVLKDLSELQRLWDDALINAVETNRAEQAQSEQSEVIFQRRSAKDNNAIADTSNSTSIKEQLKANAQILNEMEPVANIKHLGAKGKNKTQQRQEIVAEFKKYGFQTERKGFGTIIFEEKQINQSLNYLTSDSEFAAFFAVPQVLKKGVEISDHSNHKRRDYATITFAAPVTINETTGNMAVVVKKTKGNRYKTHRILMPDGSAFVFNEINKAEATPGSMTVETNGEGLPITSATDTTIPQKAQPVNTSIAENSENDTKRQLRTDAQSSRDLLATALDTVAQTAEEKSKLLLYQEAIGKVNQFQDELTKVRAEIKELSFAKGKRDTDKIAMLQQQATKLEKAVNRYDNRLLELEATKPLKALLEREKTKAFRKARDQGAQKLANMRQKAKMTELRRDIQKTLNDLKQRVTKNTVEKHVPSKFMRAVVDVLEAINTIDPQTEIRQQKKLSDLQQKISEATDPDIKAALEEQHDRLTKRYDSLQQKLDSLSSVYATIKNDENYLVQNAFDQNLQDQLTALKEDIGDTPISEMSLEQLETVYDAVKAVKKTVQSANQLFKAEQNKTVSEYGKQAIAELKSLKSHDQRLKNGLIEAARSLDWSNLKPVYAFRNIGSKTLENLYHNVRVGEDVYAVDISEAKDKYQTCADKYNLNEWDFKKTFSFHTEKSGEIELTTEQMMSLYAYSKRAQADKHLEIGGFVFDKAVKTIKKKGIPVTYEINIASANQLTKSDLGNIKSKLTDEQIGFVDEMQSYLSKEMAAKGNEVSLKMYDVAKFKDKNYFPLKSASQYMTQNNQEQADRRIKNSAFTKETDARANNPIILRDFSEVWASHCDEMAMYHAFTLPLEDFNRVFNYRERGTDSRQNKSLRAELQNVYGKETERYISQLITDLNGGVRTQAGSENVNKFISKFKKSAVLASASVVVQQPSSIGRAVYLINPIYFTTKPAQKGDWAELKRYAPVAIIKEMGHFDTNVGQSTIDWITAKHYKGVGQKAGALLKDSNYRDDVLSRAAAIADERTWCWIWSAVKAETKAKTGLSGEELLKKAGKRFTEIIELTQVYDSVFSRSELMRSKDAGMKMATAFMGEPTTSWNMMRDAVVQAKRGSTPKTQVARALSAYVLSNALAAMLESFVTAARDDDEDKTYIEKYTGELVSNFIDNLNPFSLIPFVRDVNSLFHGYDVDRADMSLFSDLRDALFALDDTNKSWDQKLEAVVGAIGGFFGIPVKNVWRDVRGVFNLIGSKNIFETSASGVKYSILAELGIMSEGDELYYAIASGDEEHATRIREELKAQYRKKDKTLKEAESAINSSIKSAMREHDSRVKEAAQAMLDNDTTKYKRLLNEIVSDGFEQDLVAEAIKTEKNKIIKANSKDEEEEANDSTDAKSSIYDSDDLNRALEAGEDKAVQEIIADMLEVKAENAKQKLLDKGYNNVRATREATTTAKSSIRSQLTKYWKPIYQAASAEEKVQIRKMLYDTGVYNSLGSIHKSLSKQS